MAKFNFIVNKKPRKESDFLVIKSRQRRIEMNLRAYQIKDHDYFIQYIPSLNLSGYGDTEDEALEMLKVVVEDYCENLSCLKPELQAAELSKYGFKQERWKSKQYTSNAHIDKLGVLQNFELPADTPIEESSILV
jgi:predicted RNase H-like HicB family nuclease